MTEYESMDYNIPIKSRSRILRLVRESIKSSWMAPTRRKIKEIKFAKNISGTVISIVMKSSNSPPTLGGYTDGLLQDGFGYIHYDNQAVYIAPIIHSSSNDTFYFKGRNNKSFKNNLDIIDNLSIQTEYENVKEKRNVFEIKNMITDRWSKRTLKNVKEIKPSSSSGTYIINFEVNGEKVKDEESNIIEVIYDEPTIATKDSLDALLIDGWVVSGIKTGMLFISKINHIISEDVLYEFKNREPKTTYKPRACEKCMDREFEDYFVVDEQNDELTGKTIPISKAMCNYCYHDAGESVVTLDEYYEMD